MKWGENVEGDSSVPKVAEVDCVARQSKDRRNGRTSYNCSGVGVTATIIDSIMNDNTNHHTILTHLNET